MFDPWSAFMSWAAKKGFDKLYSKVTAWFDNPTARGVLIIGPGGVGKTTLGQFLSGQEDKAPSGSYVESVSTEEFKLADDVAVQIVIPPGQAHRRKATWDQRLEEVAEGKFRGVIIIHAYGHHALGDISYENHKLYDPEKGLDAFVTDYLESGLKTEEQILKMVCEAVKKCAAPIWVLTLVTKQDLWWDERDNVEKHYAEGRFGKIVKECLGGKSERKFRHETAYASLVIRNLVTGRNEVIKKTVSGYDAPLQEKSFEKLLRVFDGLMQWEKEHEE
jgi:hypothetical protein